MRELLELVALLQRSKLTNSTWWPTWFESGSKMEQLLNAMLAGQVSTDEEAAAALYGAEAGSASGKLANVKSRLRERLLDAVFLLDVGGAPTDRQQAYFEGQKKWAAAMVLLSRHARRAALDVLEQLLRHARYFEFTELAINVLYQLRRHYGNLPTERKKYALYRDEYRSAQVLWMAENEAEDAYNDLMAHYTGTRAGREHLAKEADRHYRQVAPLLATSNSFRLHLSGRLLQMTAVAYQGDHAAALRCCEDAIAFFEAKPYLSVAPLQVFYYQAIVCCIQLRNFKRGQEFIANQQAVCEEGSYNWFKFQELLFILGMHTQQYNEAFVVQGVVLNHRKFNQLPDDQQETWKIYAAYAHYLVHIGRATAPEGAKKFKLAKFVNEVPAFSQDKRGMNIPILIVQLLFCLADNRRSDAVDRVEAVSKYCSRYLRDDEQIRSHCLLQMLLQLPQAGFHRVAAERKAEKFRARLAKVPLEIANQPFELEIIPYEDLWEMALASIA